MVVVGSPIILFIQGSDVQREFVELLLVNARRGVKHDVASGIVFGERYAIANAVETSEQ